MVLPGVEVRVRFPVADDVLSDLHAPAFNSRLGGAQPWAGRLQRHSQTWAGAFIDDILIGFVHASWDGAAHAFLLDTVVEPAHQRRGDGQLLVRTVVIEVTAAGCEWLHVDYEPHLDAFYRKACGFPTTNAGLLRLNR